MVSPIDIRNKDLAAGLLFIGISLCFAVLGRDLEIGIPTDMGPGFFPLTVAALLGLLGLAITINALRMRSGSLLTIAWRPLSIITVAPVIFALLIEPFGLAPALGIAVLFSTFASRSRNLWRSLGLSAAIVLFCWLVFAAAFGVPIPIARWPG